MFGPIFFEENRVYRVYSGGKLIGKLKNKDEVDSNYPEEWLASTVSAFDNNFAGKIEGYSIVKNTNKLFKDFIDEYPYEMLGNKKWDVLVKFLDSAARLPIQVHPTAEQSKKYFNGENGKNEMWIVLETRENASLYYGFKEKYTKEYFKEEVLKSEKEKEILVPLLNKLEVEKGDIYFIPANRVHAIGFGCLILEIQEASDYTISPEFYCENNKLSDYERFLGLDLDTGLSMFNFNDYGEDVVMRGKLIPKKLETTNDYVKYEISNYQTTKCFASIKYEIKNKLKLSSGPALYVITDGEGIVKFKNENTKVTKGDYFFIPYIVKEQVEIYSKNIELYVCLPSK